MFYLASALLMPMRSIWSVARGRPGDARWGVAMRQASLAAGILGTLWVTGWVLGWMIAAFMPETSTLGGSAAGGDVRNVVRISALALSFGTLGLVLLAVQLLRVLLPRARTVPVPPVQAGRRAA